MYTSFEYILNFDHFALVVNTYELKLFFDINLLDNIFRMDLISDTNSINSIFKNNLSKKLSALDFNYAHQLGSINNLISSLSNSVKKTTTSSWHFIANTPKDGNYWANIILWCIRYLLEHLYLFIAMLGYLSQMLPKNKWFLFIFTFLTNFTFVGGANVNTISKSGLSWLTFGTWVVYIPMNAYYDYLFNQYLRKEPNFFKYNKEHFKHRLFAGFVFLPTIIMGMIFSTCFSNLILNISLTSDITLFVFSNVISYFAAVGWVVLVQFSIHRMLPQNMVSVLRALLYSILFGFLSVSNFYIREHWVQVPYANWLAIVVGISLYIPSMLYQIHLEETVSNTWVYGLAYVITFSTFSVATSGLYYLYERYLSLYPPLLYILLILLPLATLVGFPMEYYRVTTLNRRVTSSLTNRLFRILCFLITFICFSNPTFIIMNWFPR